MFPEIKNATMLVVLLSFVLEGSSFQSFYCSNQFLIQKRNVVGCSVEIAEKDLGGLNIEDIVLYNGPEAHHDDMEAGCSIENLGTHIYA
jgi:hypothetical protein